MLLACARLIRTPLGVDDVAAIWNPRDKLLALACERDLESANSPAARKVVWSHHGRRPPILGPRINFAPKDTYFVGFDRIEKPLLRKMRRKDGPDEIIALMALHMDGRGDGWTIEIKAGRRTLTCKDLYCGQWSREMTDAEFGRLTAMIERSDFENLPPLTRQGIDGTEYEYLHLTRNSALRVYMNNPGYSQSPGTPYDLLLRFFRGLEK